MFEILTGKAEAGGTVAFQKDTLDRAKKDLADQLNARKGAKVHSVTIDRENGEVHIVAVVETGEAKAEKTGKKKKKKGLTVKKHNAGKGE